MSQRVCVNNKLSSRKTVMLVGWDVSDTEDCEDAEVSVAPLVRGSDVKLWLQAGVTGPTTNWCVTFVTRVTER